MNLLLVMDSPVPLMHHDPDRSRITDPDPDHPKGTQPKFYIDNDPIEIGQNYTLLCITENVSLILDEFKGKVFHALFSFITHCQFFLQF